MAKDPLYPLEEVLSIKKNRFDKAVKVLEEKKEALEKAYEALFDVTEIFNAAQNHKEKKLTQLRNEMDEGTTTDKIQQMKAYLKVVDEDLLEKKRKVDQQQKKVDAAQVEVDKATDDLFQKKKDVEKIELHKKEWMKGARYELERKEGIEHDEQGSHMYSHKKREKLREKEDS